MNTAIGECAFCGTLAKDQPLHFCSGCRQRKYCNQACQRAAWRAGHKDECMRLRAKSKSKSTSRSSSSPFPLSAAAASTSLSSASAASPSQGPGGEGGGNRSESPETTSILPAAATASSTRKTRTKQGESNTDTTNGPAAIDELPNTTHVPTDLGDGDNPSKKAGVKTMWVTIFKCFHCGKRGHDLNKCLQCEEAYYCDRKCLEAHATSHAKVCIATVTAKAQRAHRERLARAVRENGKDNVEGGEEDDLCVICQSRPVNAVKVSLCSADAYMNCVIRAFVQAIDPHPCLPHLSTASVRPQVLQVVRGGAAPERGGQVVPPLPQAAAARAGEAVRLGLWDLCEDQGCDRPEPPWG